MSTKKTKHERLKQKIIELDMAIPGYISGQYINNVDNQIAGAKRGKTTGMARIICGEEELMES